MRRAWAIPRTSGRFWAQTTERDFALLRSREQRVDNWECVRPLRAIFGEMPERALDSRQNRRSFFDGVVAGRKVLRQLLLQLRGAHAADEVGHDLLGLQQ